METAKRRIPPNAACYTQRLAAHLQSLRLATVRKRADRFKTLEAGGLHSWTFGTAKEFDMRTHPVLLLFIPLIALTMVGTRHNRAAAAGGAERPLLKEHLANVPGSDLTAVVVNYAPGGKSPAHHHAGSVFAYVLSGSIRSQNSMTGPARVYQTGEVFFEPSGSEHLISENGSATKPASLLAVFVAPTEATLTLPSR